MNTQTQMEEEEAQHPKHSLVPWPRFETPSRVKTRMRFSLAKKVEILKYLSTGKKQSEAAKHFGVPRGTVCQIFASRTKILESFGQNMNGSLTTLATSPFSAMEPTLFEWIESAKKNRIPLSGPLVKDKAMEFAAERGMEGFLASNGWLSRFKHRFNLGPGYELMLPQDDESEDSERLNTYVKDLEAIYNAEAEEADSNVEDTSTDHSNSNSSVVDKAPTIPPTKKSPTSAKTHDAEDRREMVKSLESYFNSVVTSTSKPSKKPSKQPQRTRLDLTTKVQILNYLAKGKKQIEAARRFGVARGTVTEIFRRRFELIERFGRCKNRKAKSTKESPFQAIEDPLIQWINDARKNNIPLNLTLVTEKALEIAKDVGLERFSASPGWMYRFRKRNSFGPNFDQETALQILDDDEEDVDDHNYVEEEDDDDSISVESRDFDLIKVEDFNDFSAIDVTSSSDVLERTPKTSRSRGPSNSSIQQRDINYGTTELDQSCPFCSFQFIDETNFRNHIREELEVYRGKSVCPECRVHCRNPDKMIDHFFAVHAGLQRFVCGVDDCVEAFWTDSELRAHERSHA